jgi:SAM-dependent methyltransferase
LFLDLEWPLLLAELQPQGRIADFGCGSGTIAGALARALPLASVWGLDADELALEQGRVLQNASRNLRFDTYALGRGQACPVGNLDLAFTRFVLLHLSDPVAALKDMAGALGPGGKLYVVESDDSCMRFDPPPPWQERLLALFEQVQQGRGGSRCRGSQMGSLLQAAGLQPRLLATVHYCKSRIGAEAFQELFLPVAAFYLQEAVKRAWLDEGEGAALLEKVRVYMADSTTEIDMALFHWISMGTFLQG